MSTLKVQSLQHTSGTTALTLDSSGRVLLPNQPYARVYYRSATNTSYGASTTTEIKFNSVDSNVGSHYSTTTGRFTCPVAGVYLMMSTIQVSPGNTDWAINYFACVNGSGYAGTYEASVNKQYWAGRSYAIVNANANDYLSFILATNVNTGHEINPGDVRNNAMFYFLG